MVPWQAFNIETERRKGGGWVEFGWSEWRSDYKTHSMMLVYHIHIHIHIHIHTVHT